MTVQHPTKSISRPAITVVASVGLTAWLAGSPATGLSDGPSERPAKSAISVSVTGVPPRSQLSLPPRFTVAGPLGTRHVKTWRVGQGRRLTGLPAGQYILRAGYAKATDSEGFAPTKQTRWIRLQPGTSKRFVSHYASLGLAAIIPPPPVDWVRIDVTQACHFAASDDSAYPFSRGGDPYTWTCYSPRRPEGAKFVVPNFNEYCMSIKTSNFPWWAVLDGKDWYCKSGMHG